eukprot:Selendium_serpulae@DN4529_c0_g1_i1.p1
MDTLIGIKGDDFVMMAADTLSAFSIFRMKHDEDKIMVVDGDKVIGTSGPAGDRVQFGEYIRKNIHLHRLQTGKPLNTDAAANFARKELAYSLRQSPYQVNLLMAGYDEDGPAMYWIDYLASMVSVKKGAHGYAAYFVGGILDRYYKPGMTEDEAFAIMNLCAKELKERFMISQYDFIVKTIDKNGIRERSIKLC